MATPKTSKKVDILTQFINGAVELKDSLAIEVATALRETGPLEIVARYILPNLTTKKPNPTPALRLLGELLTQCPQYKAEQFLHNSPSATLAVIMREAMLHPEGPTKLIIKAVQRTCNDGTQETPISSLYVQSKGPVVVSELLQTLAELKPAARKAAVATLHTHLYPILEHEGLAGSIREAYGIDPYQYHEDPLKNATAQFEVGERSKAIEWLAKNVDKIPLKELRTLLATTIKKGEYAGNSLLQVLATFRFYEPKEPNTLTNQQVFFDKVPLAVFTPELLNLPKAHYSIAHLILNERIAKLDPKLLTPELLARHFKLPDTEYTTTPATKSLQLHKSWEDNSTLGELLASYLQGKNKGQGELEQEALIKGTLNPTTGDLTIKAPTGEPIPAELRFPPARLRVLNALSKGKELTIHLNESTSKTLKGRLERDHRHHAWPYMPPYHPKMGFHPMDTWDAFSITVAWDTIHSLNGLPRKEWDNKINAHIHKEIQAGLKLLHKTNR